MTPVTCKNELVYPKALFCVGRNYSEHIAELGNAKPEECLFFTKTPHALAQDLHVSFHDEPIHYEAELVFVLDGDLLTAVGVGLDLTKRELQTKLKTKSLPWERAKSFRVSALVSECVGFDVLESLRLELWVNNVLVQSGGVKDMIYSPLLALELLHSWSDTHKNDLLFTGTPKGVGVVNVGDVFTGKVYENDKLLVEKTWIAS